MNSKRDWYEMARAAGEYAVRLAFVAFVAAMAVAVLKLGETFTQPLEMRLLVAAGCAIGIFGHGVAVTATKNGTNAGRMMHGIALAVWLVLSVFLAGLYAFTSNELLASFVPEGMGNLGATVYALAFGIGLFTSTLALVVPAVAARPINDPTLPTLGSAVARFGEPLFLLLCIGASSLHLFTFGLEVAKVGLFSTVAAMVIADLAFVVAEKRVLHELRARRAAGRYDKFDLIAWGVFGLLVLVYLVLVNVYSVRHSAGTLDAGDPLLKTVIDFYGASPTLLILSMAALALITAFVDIHGQGNDLDAGAVTVKRPSIAHRAGMIAARPSILADEFRRGRESAIGAPRIAAPAAAQLADEGVTVATVKTVETVTNAGAEVTTRERKSKRN
jgi:protein-S-isoprenylcysteine O-methyltransferase Ste14